MFCVSGPQNTRHGNTLWFREQLRCYLGPDHHHRREKQFRGADSAARRHSLINSSFVVHLLSGPIGARIWPACQRVFIIITRCTLEHPFIRRAQSTFQTLINEAPTAPLPGRLPAVRSVHLVSQARRLQRGLGRAKQPLWTGPGPACWLDVGGGEDWGSLAASALLLTFPDGKRISGG